MLKNALLFASALLILLSGYLTYIYYTDLVVFDQVTTETVSFQSVDITLSGELAKPEGVENPPVFVFIHGSGETPKEDLAWYARKANKHGYASITFDKRGVGNSEGAEDFHRYFDFESLARDVAAAVQFAANRSDLNGSEIYLFAVSQGGWVAPLATSLSDVPIAGMIVISASVVPVREDRIFERAARLKREGFTEEEVEQATKLQIADQNFSSDSTSYDSLKLLWDQYKDERWFRRVYLSEEPLDYSHSWRQHHSKIIDFNPLPILQNLEMPVVWIFGDPELDGLGPVKQSITNLEGLKSQGKEYLILTYPGYDHNLERKILFDLVPTYSDWEKPAFNFFK